VNASIENELQALSDGLDKGLFVANLEALIEITKRILSKADDDEILLGGYVVESVLADLQTFWEDYPLSPAAFELVNAELGPVLKRVVTAMMDPGRRVFLPSHLASLIAGFLALQHSDVLR
jgi:hypothetical protein